jgi:hypothetical protein
MDLAKMLKELSGLPQADRKAILKRLSGDERKALVRAEREARIPFRIRALSNYSPWLVRRLAPIARSGAEPSRSPLPVAVRLAVLDAMDSLHSPAARV